MLELTQRTARAESRPPRLTSNWQGPLTVVNLRLDPIDAAVTDAVAEALGLPLPLTPCTACGDAHLRTVWAGPDDWFLIGPAGLAETWTARLSAVLTGRHHAITDVSSGYRVLQLAGPSARELLAQGCPLDLHPRTFQPGMSAGTVFFKASVWLWQTETTPVEAPHYELLVRSSFQGYVQLLVERCRAAQGMSCARPPSIPG